MDLQSIVIKFKNSRNIQEKRKLKPILDNISSNGYKTSQIYASYGEDSAAIQLTPTSKDLILITTDAILPVFIEKSPWGAGFSAIYVGIDDILWIGTDGGGVNRFDIKNKKFFHIQYHPDDQNSLSSNDIRAIHVDRQKNVWVGTIKGLSRIQFSSDSTYSPL